MKLHSDNEAFGEIVALAAEKFGYEQSHVEKDYWVSKVLRDISMSEFKERAFLKGGTSLSKGYGLITRFSEDLDLFVFTGDTESSRKAERILNRDLSKFIIEANNDIYKENMSLIGGNYRKLYFAYENVFPSIGLKDHLEVELKTCDLQDKSQMYYPTDTREIKPIVTSFLESIGQEGLIREYGLQGFNVQCINPRRTMCDKISRLVKVSYNDNYEELLAKNIRDIYDLQTLCHQMEYSEFLNSDDFHRAMHRVSIEDSISKNSKSHMSLADAIIFKEPDMTMTKPLISNAYSVELKKLLFNKSELPSIEDVIRTLKRLHEILIGFEEYRTH